jgi:hypothetical protein
MTQERSDIFPRRHVGRYFEDHALVIRATVMGGAAERTVPRERFRHRGSPTLTIPDGNSLSVAISVAPSRSRAVY